MSQFTSDANAPLFYQPAYEILEEHEAETQASLIETLLNISETTFKNSQHAIRSVHAKSHGLLRAQLEVFDNLPAVFAQGIFSKPGSWPAVIRLSTIPGDILDDNVSTPRGFAIKIVGVKGDRLSGSEAATTQDFVLVNAPAFSTANAKKFLANLKLLATTTDKAPGLKKALSTVFRGLEKAIEVSGGESATLKALGGHPTTDILGETFYSQVPILFGHYMAKVSIAPVSKNLVDLVDQEIDLSGNPDGVRSAVIDFFKTHEAVWELRIQLCTDVALMPIEDASIEWPEQQSPYFAVARIVAKPQAGWSDALSALVDDAMSFSPWHGVTSHRPLGAIMRIRKAAYEISTSFRAKHNGITISEPAHLNDFPTN